MKNKLLTTDFFLTILIASGQEADDLYVPGEINAAIANGTRTKLNDNNYIRVYNEGGLPLPLKLKVEYENGEEENSELKSDIWKENSVYYDVLISKNEVRSVVLYTQTVPDVNPLDNRLKI